MAASIESHLLSVKAPINNEKVYKEECMYCFDTPFSETGLYVCMQFFYGFGKNYVAEYSQQTGSKVFLHLKKEKKLLPKADEEPERKKPTKLAIGLEGGFDTTEERYEVIEKFSIVILPEWVVITLPDDSLPGLVQLSVAAILGADSATKREEITALSNTWEGEQRVISKYADSLEQLNPGKKILPSGWKCQLCDLTTNLWLNLTDGAILCGRKYFDGTGGNNHALKYYEEKKYPLAVKLGTITPDGADVYSYAEDDMVIDPHLSKHLAHFGIDIMAMKQTEKTMIELEIDLNQKIGEWDVIQEAGSELTPLYGSGFTGMHNLGNSCYMNSAIQVLFTIPDFKEKYADKKDNFFKEASLDSICDNFNAQMAKLGTGLLSGDYSKEKPDNSDIVFSNGITPTVFKLLVGRGHPEFSSKKQQDVQEYLLHLFKMIERNSRSSGNALDSLRFKVEERIECTESKCVKYNETEQYLLSLDVPMAKAENIPDVAAFEAMVKELEAAGKKITDPKQIVRPRITMKSCFDSLIESGTVTDFYSSALKRHTNASVCTKLKTFPSFLFLHMRKFTVSENWTPKKLDVSLDVPDILDLSYLRGQGRQPGEADFPEGEKSAEPALQLNEELVAQLMDMGFHIEGCKKAVFHTKNAGIEPAMNWVIEHMADSDFESPFDMPVTDSVQSGNEGFIPDEEGLAMIMSMGFAMEQATLALKATDNNLERAVDWIFSHPDATSMESEQAAEVTTPAYRDGSGKYKLKAFISHMGTSTDVGHYVCHINKDGRWVIFNDEKVALSKNPPRDLAYIYLYEQM